VLQSIFAFLFLISIGPFASAQTWPSKPIRLVVPYTAGGQFDVTARIVASRMSKVLATPVVVENRAGGSTVIGADLVAKSSNDGYTLLFAGSNTFAVLPFVNSTLPFKPTDFQSISMVIEFPLGIMVGAEVPANNFAELVAYGKANPNKLVFGTSGQAGLQQLLCELAKSSGQFQMTQVAYRGSAEIIQDLIPGRISVACDALAAYVPHVRSGKLKLLGVSSAQRMKSLPNVPTLKEQGFPQITASAWAAIFAPAGTDPEIVKRLNAAIVEAAKDPDVASKIEGFEGRPWTTSPRELDQVIRSDSETWSRIIRTLGLDQTR
jgi:tripartite-type tricarboxylate transporter receptor subunit TctC